MDFLLNLLFGFLAFFVVRWVGSMVIPDGQDSGRIVTVVAVIVGIIVFLADFAVQVRR